MVKPSSSYVSWLLHWLSPTTRFSYLEGLKKDDPANFNITSKIADDFLNVVLIKQNGIEKHGKALPDNYQFVGTNNDVLNLELLLKNNPFYVGSLIHRIENGKSIFVIESIGQETFYSKVINALDSNYKRFNAKFDENLKLIEITDALTGTIITDPIAFQKAATQLLFSVTYYVEMIHISVHIFQFAMATGIAEATSNFNLFKNWALPYIYNIELPYREVKYALINEAGVLVSEKGVIANRTEVLNVLREMQTTFGSSNSALDFVDKFIFTNINNTPEGKAQAEKIGILKEFLKHTHLIGPYASEMEDALSSDDWNILTPLVKREYLKANQLLKNFMSEIGPRNSQFGSFSKVNNIKTWIELASVTGMIHGSTTSFSRLFLTPSIVSCVSDSETYGQREISVASTATGTIVGAVSERYMFTNSFFSRKFGLSKVNKVTAKYNDITTQLKEDYYRELLRDEENFRTNGWLISDYCPDLTDGKQLCFSTYF